MRSFLLVLRFANIWDFVTFPAFMFELSTANIKGQLQLFHELISNDRIWPSEHGFEVIFAKSLFVFEISAFKVRN